MKVVINPVGANLDIVLVPGLNVRNRESHEEGTWTAQTPSGDVHWVRETFPLDTVTRRARVMAYAYSSREVVGSVHAGVALHAKCLLDQLLVLRRGAETRPLIFITHSLGGIIVKEALVQATESFTRLRCISLFTTGVIFFGAPHRGIENGKFQFLTSLLRSFTPFDPDPLLLASIDKSNPECERLHKRFSKVHEHYYYVSVYEAQPYRNKDLGLLVPMASAVLGLPDDREVRLRLDRDHSRICRFEDLHSTDFRLVFFHLRDLCQRSIGSFSNLKHISESGRRVTEKIAAQKLSDGQTIQQAIVDAQTLLQSTDTVAGVQGLNERVRARLNQTNTRIASFLIILIIPILPLPAFLVGLGLAFGMFTVDQVTPLIRLAADRLEDIRTGQNHSLILSYLSIQLFDRKFKSVDMARKTLEGHLSFTPMTADEAGEARDLIARLDTHEARIFSDLHRRRDSAASIRGRLEVTTEFLERLYQAQQE